MDREKLLLVEDSSEGIKILSSILNDFDLIMAKNGNEMWEILMKETPDLILMDVIMPGDDGFFLSRELLSIEQYSDIPVVFISSKDTGEDVAEGFKSGGYDYIKKPFDRLEIRARVKSALMKKAVEKELLEKSFTDPLTSLYNRRFFIDSLTKHIQYCKRNSSLFSIAMMDIDFFKKINDLYGHIAGDFILKKFSIILKNYFRSYDIVSRYGGEEFIILLVDCSKSDSEEIIKRINNKISKTEFKYNNEIISFTFTSGVTDNNDFEKESLSPESIMMLADERLYKGKKKGRNCVVST